MLAVRSAVFASLVASTLAFFWTPITTLIHFSFQHEHYSHIILVPLVSAALFILERRRLLSHVATAWLPGLGLLVAGVFFYSIAQRYAAPLSENDRLAMTMLSMVTLWGGAFVLCYGLRASRQGLFPLLFLVLMIPIPDFLLNRVIAGLLRGSADASHVILELVGVPFLRTGLIFSFPGFAIEIAEECSGIRSSMALLVVSLLAGHLFLRSIWTKAVLTLATVPLLIVKNGIRIATLSLLTMYVDPGFLTGSLHRQGGFAFFLLTLAFLAPLLWFLQNSERRRATSGT